MSANPPGVEELDPTDVLLDEPTDEVDPNPLTDTPPATPDGHHQTHGVPVSTN